MCPVEDLARFDDPAGRAVAHVVDGAAARPIDASKPENLDPRQKALTAFCVVLLNTNEFFYLN